MSLSVGGFLFRNLGNAHSWSILSNREHASQGLLPIFLPAVVCLPVTRSYQIRARFPGVTFHYIRK